MYKHLKISLKRNFKPCKVSIKFYFYNLFNLCFLFHIIFILRIPENSSNENVIYDVTGLFHWCPDVHFEASLWVKYYIF